ncbi:DNA repair protein XRCC3 isoform X3 [Diceros bicornis minor]|uniref:DNA repair protein XRCC3 isoform X3 n=1 Tax=Diceros bicornis minor TaxID=77932 RepID=UPI0026F333EA|nr:DNA repair protein XRCC3 isoform X3 [Diceros bicornis minor]
MDLDQLDLNPRIIAAIKKAKLKSVKEVLHFSGPDLQRLTGLSGPDVQHLLRTASSHLRGSSVLTALHLFRQKESFPAQHQRLSLGCPVLDGLLRGGLPLDGITELAGRSSAGKTQLALQLCLAVQLPRRHGGLEAVAAKTQLSPRSPGLQGEPGKWNRGNICTVEPLRGISLRFQEGAFPKACWPWGCLRVHRRRLPEQASAAAHRAAALPAHRHPGRDGQEDQIWQPDLHRACSRRDEPLGPLEQAATGASAACSPGHPKGTTAQRRMGPAVQAGCPGERRLCWVLLLPLMERKAPSSEHKGPPPGQGLVGTQPPQIADRQLAAPLRNATSGSITKSWAPSLWTDNPQGVGRRAAGARQVGGEAGRDLVSFSA